MDKKDFFEKKSRYFPLFYFYIPSACFFPALLYTSGIRKTVMKRIMPAIVFSSETYRIDPADIAVLKDAPHFSPSGEKTEHPVVLIGCNPVAEDFSSEDVLLSGRDAVIRAMEEKRPFIPVRMAFIPRNKPYDVLSPLIRKLRYKIRFYGSNIYHISPKDVRKMKIERTEKTRENAYSFTNPKYRMPLQERRDEYDRIFNSIKENGFKDDDPIDIMLCRLAGSKDCVNNGHHRIGISLELGLDRIPVRFSAAGAAPRFFRPALRLFSTFNLAFKRRFGH